ncbi:MAG: F0F1 ATP synthase subunit A [Terrimicrobiaceae bacterium]|nr:F0F1 ATP synthase subunit A [Terrimicrobiaceae bacterium]
MTICCVFAEAVPMGATSLFGGASDGGFAAWLTNSIFVSALVAGVILLFARKAVRNAKIVPDGPQNLFEAVVENLYNAMESIVGRRMIGRSFGLLASLFIYILIANWFSLLPGVGSIGWSNEPLGPFHSATGEIEHPLLRPATSDLNLTLALTIVSMSLWFVWTMQEVGPWGFLKHTFGSKGGMTGILGMVLAVVFFLVGFLELISIGTRALSLPLRLYGNIYAGENLIGMMMGLGAEFHWPPWLATISSVLIPIPFSFLELMVGFLQALVFMLLTAVYIQLSTSHDEEAH